MPEQLHAVHKLYDYRSSISMRPYRARGMKLVRCRRCLLDQQFCTCDIRQLLPSNAAFLLIMHDIEVLKPSNSGRLIADLIPDTHAFIWSRTMPHPDMLALLDNPIYQPYVIFPAEYATPTQTVLQSLSGETERLTNKKPLFILLDGSWREAVKMFRKSTYLHHLPVLSFTKETLSNYQLRLGKQSFQLGTAEVAVLTLQAFNEVSNAEILNDWFQLFVESTMIKRTREKGTTDAKIRALRQQVITKLSAIPFS